MTIGIIGLGLIGGSLAKALSQTNRVLGYDIQRGVMLRAAEEGAIDGLLKTEELAECELVIIALYPQAAEEFLNAHAADFRKNGIVTDCTGIKSEICRLGFSLAEKHGFVFVGGHPMAGREYSGYEVSDARLFENASMIFVPQKDCPATVTEALEQTFRTAGFGSVIFTTAAEHDRIIAFTSQLAHVVSNAYVRSPASELHTGFSAGSYKDMTRVAYLNEEMWTQLFIRNSECLCDELDGLLRRLEEYRDAIRDSDAARLSALLRDGREKKIQIDGGTD